MKQIREFTVKSAERYGELYALLTLTTTDGLELPECRPGQFVQVAVEAPGVFLRRPISINSVDIAEGVLTLLVRDAGKATHQLVNMTAGERLNIILPLGNGFTTGLPAGSRVLLAGGGVGVAPMFYLGTELKREGLAPEFLLGARSADQLLMLDEFRKIGEVHICTDDGSLGTHGVVTDHEVLSTHLDRIYCCGPAPMMKAVARVAREKGVECEVSLENMMACGLGACLCCVEKTVRGNVCVCTEGPVFNISELTW
ncbi:MAG: dihydroorotate dehydrogenase electron transfer subunit [Duncaniella sp.]|nr:dihydroorotate dehydrogenase electron transfer subunit [Duncaniella sp.]